MKTLSAIPADQQRLIVTVLIGLATLAIAHQFILQPLAAQRAALEVELATGKQLRTLIHTVEGTTASLNRLESRLPLRQDITSVLQTLSTLAGQYGVTLSSVSPHTPQGTGPYVRLPIQMEVQGTYPGLLQFLDAIGQHTVPLHVEEVEVSSPRPVTTGDALAEDPVPLNATIRVSALLRDAAR